MTFLTPLGTKKGILQRNSITHTFALSLDDDDSMLNYYSAGHEVLNLCYLISFSQIIICGKEHTWVCEKRLKCSVARRGLLAAGFVGRLLYTTFLCDIG